MGLNRPGGGASADARQIWQVALERIAQRVSASAYTTWFRGTSALELTQDTLVVGVGNTFACEHLRQRFLELARAAVSEALGRAAEVAFVLRDHAAAAQPASPTPTNPLPTPPTRRPARPRAAWTAHQSAAVARVRSRPAGGSEPAAAQTPLPLAQPEPARALHPTTPLMPDAAGVSHELNPRYVFETFIVGTANRLAYAAADEVSRDAGRAL